MSEAPGFENRCEKTLNEGRHVCLQMRGHEGECQPNVNAPWPPVPATPLDVEACAHDWGWEPLKFSTNVCDPKQVVCVRCRKRRAWRRSDKGNLQGTRGIAMTDTVDVEACVRLLTDYRRILKEKLHKCSIRSVCHTPFPCSTCRGICGDIDQVGALASALPGMGKDSEDAARYRFVKRYLRVETDDGSMSEFLFMDDALCSEDTVAEGFDNTVDSLIDQAIAARAAQPEETSADA